MGEKQGALWDHVCVCGDPGPSCEAFQRTAFAFSLGAHQACLGSCGAPTVSQGRRQEEGKHKRSPLHPSPLSTLASPSRMLTPLGLSPGCKQETGWEIYVKTTLHRRDGDRGELKLEESAPAARSSGSSICRSITNMPWTAVLFVSPCTGQGRLPACWGPGKTSSHGEELS